MRTPLRPQAELDSAILSAVAEAREAVTALVSDTERLIFSTYEEEAESVEMMDP